MALISKERSHRRNRNPELKGLLTILQYRSPWPYPPTPDSIALRGVNRAAKSAVRNNLMLKVEAVEQDDELGFSVDPHLIQPQIVQPTLEDLLIERDTETHFCRSPKDAQCLPIIDGNVRMEHCINLDLYLAPIPDKMDNFYTDELNTPDTFEATKELNKIINTTHLKQSYGNPFNFPAAAAQPMVTSSAALAIERLRETTSKRSAPATFTFGTDSQMQNLNQPLEGEMMMDGDAVDHGGLLTPEHFLSDDINLSEYDLLTDWKDAIINDMNSDNVTQRDNDVVQFAPEAMVSCVNATTVNEHHNYALKLNFGQLLPSEGEALPTPDIINTILNYDEDTQGMGIQGQLVTPQQIKQELQALKEEDPEIFFTTEQEQHSSPEEFKPQDDDSSMQSAASSMVVAPSKGKRLRRKKQDSDDEDYVPPSHTPRRGVVRRKTIRVEDSDDEDYTPAKIPKRGRPSKASVSARSSESSECSKYREMRDKNNEASRRSRRKRRMQERGIEEECETLEIDNVRLRAKVAEMEKSVAMYRSNIMSLLMNKAN